MCIRARFVFDWNVVLFLIVNMLVSVVIAVFRFPVENRIPFRLSGPSE
jgi:hypothetical protein